MTIQEFVDKSEVANAYRKDCEWEGYTVYELWEKGTEGACIGYPILALEKDGKIRLSTFPETQAIMDKDI